MLIVCLKYMRGREFCEDICESICIYRIRYREIVVKCVELCV